MPKHAHYVYDGLCLKSPFPVTQPHLVSEPQLPAQARQLKLQITHCCIPLLGRESAGQFRASLQFVVVADLVPSFLLCLCRLVRACMQHARLLSPPMSLGT